VEKKQEQFRIEKQGSEKKSRKFSGVKGGGMG